MKLVTNFCVFKKDTEEEIEARITTLIDEIRKFASEFRNAALFPGVKNGNGNPSRVAIVTGTFGDAAEEADVLDEKAAIGALRKILKWTADLMYDDPRDATEPILGSDFSHTELKVVISDLEMEGTKIVMIHDGGEEYEDEVFRTIFILPILGSFEKAMEETEEQ